LNESQGIPYRKRVVSGLAVGKVSGVEEIILGLTVTVFVHETEIGRSKIRVSFLYRDSINIRIYFITTFTIRPGTTTTFEGVDSPIHFFALSSERTVLITSFLLISTGSSILNLNLPLNDTGYS